MSEEELMSALALAYTRSGGKLETVHALWTLLQDYVFDDETYENILHFFTWVHDQLTPPEK